MSERGFYGLCGLPNFFGGIMTLHFAEMISTNQAITYIDDVIHQAKPKMICGKTSNLFSNAGDHPRPQKPEESGKQKRCSAHPRKLRFLHYVQKNLHVDSKPIYDFLSDGVPFKWTREHEKLFQNIKDRISEETILAVPNPKYPFHFHVDSSSIGTGSILLQDSPNRKRMVSFNCRVFAKDEQKMSSFHRELCGILSALQTYEHFIISSPHAIKIFCDHEQLLYLWARIGRLSHRFFRYPVIITQSSKFQIIWTPGKKLVFPDLLRKNAALKDLNGHQLAHKENPKDIRFFNQSGHEVQYLSDQKSSADDGNDIFFPLFPRIRVKQRHITFQV